MEGKYEFTDETVKADFIADKERDIKHYEKMIEKTREMLDAVGK